ncbi:MAG: hypothetical protein LC794_17855 [Acidobacteria bacterium]|nr:hypothetical protein [Acidobacteriota bacterium]
MLLSVPRNSDSYVEMTSGPNELKTALQRLIDGNASEADRDAMRTQDGPLTWN